MAKVRLNTLIPTVLGVATATLFPATANADCNISQGVAGGADCAKQGTSLPTGTLPGQIGNITKTLLIVIGAVAVIMIVIGGLRYILSQGDENSLRSAKDTVVYSVVGLVVALLAYVIVTFVLTFF